MIDVSDGLLIDTHHLLEESGKGARIREDWIPLSMLYRKYISSYSKEYYQMALSGGEDYELLFSAPPEMREKISSLALIRRNSSHPHRGNSTLKNGFRIVRKDGTEYSPTHLGLRPF